jgi:hypothetical protein
VRQQRQPGLVAVGVSVPVGRISGDDLIEFGRLARDYGGGELRLTNDQNLLLVNVPEAGIESLLAASLLQKYSPEPGSWLRRTVSRTGNRLLPLLADRHKGGRRRASPLDGGASAGGGAAACALVRLPPRLRPAPHRRHCLPRLAHPCRR